MKTMNNQQLERFIEEYHPNFIIDLGKYSSNKDHQLSMFIKNFDCDSMLLKNCVLLENGKVIRIQNQIRTSTTDCNIIFLNGYLYDLDILYKEAYKFLTNLRKRNCIECIKHKLIAADNKIENINFSVMETSDHKGFTISNMSIICGFVRIKTIENIKISIKDLSVSTLTYLIKQLNK